MTGLILVRKPSETIVLRRGDEKIVVKVLRAGSGHVRLYVDAPIEWEINRGEIDDAIQKGQAKE